LVGLKNSKILRDTPRFQSLLDRRNLPGTDTRYPSTNRPLQTSSSGHTTGSQLFQKGSFDAARGQTAHILTMDIPTDCRSLAGSRKTCKEQRTGDRALELNHVRLSRADVGRLLKDIQRLGLLQAALAIKVTPEIFRIDLLIGSFMDEKVGIGGVVCSWRRNLIYPGIVNRVSANRSMPRPI